MPVVGVLRVCFSGGFISQGPPSAFREAYLQRKQNRWGGWRCGSHIWGQGQPATSLGWIALPPGEGQVLPAPSSVPTRMTHPHTELGSQPPSGPQPLVTPAPSPLEIHPHQSFPLVLSPRQSFPMRGGRVPPLEPGSRDILRDVFSPSTLSCVSCLPRNQSGNP